MKTNRYDENRDLGAAFWGALAIILLLLGICTKCNAQQTAKLDTIPARVECIQKIISTPTKSGNLSFKCVYIDKDNGIEEIIPLSKSVCTYIQDCKQYGFTPQLGIKLKNGEIANIVRIKIKYRVCKKSK